MHLTPSDHSQFQPARCIQNSKYRLNIYICNQLFYSNSDSANTGLVAPPCVSTKQYKMNIFKEL
jgi:hypothetical protein